MDHPPALPHVRTPLLLATRRPRMALSPRLVGMWVNWSGGQQANPRRTDRPLDEAGVVAAVQRAAERGTRVRPVGAGLSGSPLVVTDDVHLDCSALTGVVSLDGDRVRVRAGTSLAALLGHLAGRGRTLTVIPDVLAASVGGAVGTGTHGGSVATGSLSAQVTGVRLVDGLGALRALDAESPELDAVRTGLGALGVLTEVELRTVPLAELAVREELRPLDAALADGTLDAHAWAALEVHVPSGEAVVRRGDPVGADDRAAAEELAAPANPVLAAASGSAEALGRVVSWLAPAPWPGSRPAWKPSSRWDGGLAIGDPHVVLPDPRPWRGEITEWAIPRDALRAALRELGAATSARGLELRRPVDVRVGPAETGWLHPAQGRATAWIAVRSPRGTDHQPLFGLVAAVLEDLEGRPHWAGRHDWTVAELERTYPRLPDFLDVRNSLDPGRRFTNDHLDTLLGP